MEVGAADPDRDHADEHLVGAWLLELDLRDLERLADGVEQRGACLQDPPPGATTLAAAKRPSSGNVAREGSARADSVRIRSRIRRPQVTSARP
jgi:hypothetical protein